jgi:hypothetical protein
MSNLENYKQKFEAQFEAWKADLEKLKAKAKNAEADQKIKYANEIKVMENRLHKAEKELKKLSGAGEDAWKTFKRDFELAWNNLSEEHEPKAHQV